MVDKTLPIYLDYMASTPVDPSVIEAMKFTLENNFGNPASHSHKFGFASAQLIEEARNHVASLIQADPREIIWTSGATEANNLAIKGAAHYYQRQGRHIITLSTEHKSVLDTCHFLETQNFSVTFLKPTENGLVDLDLLSKSIRPDTILVSVMAVNNETGVIQDLVNIGKIVKQGGALFHVDAVQAAGKIALDVKKIPIDLLSLSAHKIYGPKGIGALYVRRNPLVRLEPLIHGGGHERGLRSGTLATHQIVGMGQAFKLAQENFAKNYNDIKELHDQFWKELSQIDGIYLNGHENHKIPHCLNIRFDGIEGESLLLALHDLAISSGSACNSADPKPSHVLTSMGLSRETAYNSIRISVGRTTTLTEVQYAAKHIREQVERLRKMAPLTSNP